MTLAELKIYSLRNLAPHLISLHPRFNFFYGPNGSGKSSLLEAVYLLSTGRSFRTRETAPLITHGDLKLTVFGRTSDHQTISIQKQTASTQVRINSLVCRNSSDLARFLPVQLFYHDLFQIIDAGPAVRRSLLDWGLFHVKQSYLPLLLDYRKVLKQRNQLLRQRAKKESFTPWNKLLVDLATQIDAHRSDYFEQWMSAAQATLPLLTTTPWSIQYDKGWDKRQTGESLADLLEAQFAQDIQQQYTHSGPHQADLIIEASGIKAKQKLSRGQQKLLLIGLKLAQTRLLDKPCLYLFDDLNSELDDFHLSSLYRLLSTLDGQFFITGIKSNAPCVEEATVYFLNEGQCQIVPRETI